jgi:cytosine/adenosine deaminase-related metal-dependent hydrolase
MDLIRPPKNVTMTEQSPFFARIRAAAKAFGGLHNAHLHLDRAGTLEPPSVQTPESGQGASSLSLSKKHGLIPRIHAGPFYEAESLSARLDYYLDRMVEAGTTRADTLVDVTTDGVGLRAFQVYREAKARRSQEIELGLGAYTPLGFRDDEPERWELVLEAAREADFIGSLPERDDAESYPEHIGFLEHCRRMLVLAGQLSKSIHIHVDQRNDPSEQGAETVLQAIAEVGAPRSASGEPMVWLIHLISPSTYEEERFRKLVDGLKRHNVGVICCPSAAISMRQFRPLKTPTFNSIARVLELLAEGIPVRVGSDNICDICSPAGTPDLLWEIFVLCNAIRYYDEGVLAKIAAGRSLSAQECAAIRRHLEEDSVEVRLAIEKWSAARQRLTEV